MSRTRTSRPPWRCNARRSCVTLKRGRSTPRPSASPGRKKMPHRPRRRGLRERHDWPRQRAAVAAQIRHAAFPRPHHGQAGHHGAQDLTTRSESRSPAATTIVVSRDQRLRRAGSNRGAQSGAAFAAAHGDALRRGTDAIVVAGGAEIYAQAMPLGDAAFDHRSASTGRGRCPFPGDRSDHLARNRPRAARAANRRRDVVRFCQLRARRLMRL